MAKSIKARVLSAITLGSIVFKPNDLLQSDEKFIKRLEKSGQVDSSAAAVKYCEGEGVKAIPYDADPDVDPAAENKTALEAEIAALQSQADAATAEDKPAIEQLLADKTAELAAL